MNSQELRAIQEAYLEIYNELDEGYKPWDFGPRDKARAKYDKLAKRKAAGGSVPGTATRANKIASVGKEMRTTLDKDSAMTMTNPKKQGLQPSTPRHTLAAMKGAGGGTTARTKFKKEQVDLYDIILTHLLDEGYADTQEAATAIMVNMSEEWRESIVEEVLDEAEGSYGQTPKARQKMGDLANKRRNTPASEYSERGEKKKKVDSASRHFNRMGNPDAGNRGKKSSRPYYPAGRRGMTQKDRDWSRGADEYGHSGYDGEGGGGSLPKGKKLERQRKSGVSD